MPLRAFPRFMTSLLLAVAQIGALCDRVIAQTQPAGPQGGGEAFSAFYAEANPFLSVVEPIVFGEELFVERLRESAGDEEPLGLVLSGGSARAFAHVGVLEVLEEEGIRPDFVVANSMGAIVALLYSAGIAPSDIGALFESFPAAELFDPELPFSGGFLDAGRFMGLVRALVGDADLAALPIPAIVTCEDLVSRRQVLLAEGDLASAMAASFALPAAFEPVEFRGTLLIDGGVTSLVPVETAYRYSGRIAVATALYSPDLDYSSPFVVVNRAIDIGKTRSSIAAMLERRPLVIRCEVEDLSYMQFSRPAEVAALGRASARKSLPELREFAPPRELPANLAARRAYYHGRVAALLAAKRLDAYLGSPVDLLVRPSARFLDEASGGSEAFAGRRWAGLEAELRGGPASLALSFAAGLEGRDDRSWAAEARAGLRGYVFPKRAASGLAYDADLRALFSGSGLFDAAAGRLEPLEPRELASAGTVSLSVSPLTWLRARGEAKADLELAVPEGGAEWNASAGLGLALDPSKAIEAAWSVSMAFDSEGNVGPAVEFGLGFEAENVAALRLGGVFRRAFEGPGLKPSSAEPYRSLPFAERSESRALCSAEAVWIARVLELSFGELVIIERPELGAYADFSAAADRYRITFGGTASAGLSVIGLAPAVVSAFAGIATDGTGWVLGLRAGRAF